MAKRAEAGKCMVCAAERLLVGDDDPDEVCINSLCLLGLRDDNIRIRLRYLTACVEMKQYFKVRGDAGCGRCNGDIVFFDLSPKGSDRRGFCINTSGCVYSCLGDHNVLPAFEISRDDQREAFSYGHVCNTTSTAATSNGDGCVVM